MSDIPTPPPSTNPPRTFRIPADYYASSPHELRPLFPRWVTLGCGTAAALFLLLGFIGGAVVARNGLGPLMDPMIGSMQKEMNSMYAKDVTPGERTALDGELTALRGNVRSGKVAVGELNPVLQSLREAVSDESISHAEAVSLTQKMHTLNTARPKTRPAAKH